MADSFLGGFAGNNQGRTDFGVLPDNALPGGLPRAVPGTPAVPLAKANSTDAPVISGSAPVYTADVPGGTDFLDHGALVQPLAELLTHRASQMPVIVGLLGAPGTGKSFALNRLVGAIRSRTAAAKSDGTTISPVFVAQIDAARLLGEPESALGMALCQALLQSGNAAYAELAQHAVETANDPHDAAEAAREKLSVSRLALDSESRSLNDMRARAAKLADTLLNDPAGTPLDAYLRANRNRIEGRLRAFGFSRADTPGTYRDLVRDLHESGGKAAGTSAFMHALWAFKGQTRLVVWSILLALLGVGVVVLQATRTTWLAALANWGPNFSGPASFLTLHQDWLRPIGFGLFGLAALCLVWNFMRAWRFTRPVLKGLALLRTDIATKRNALEALIAQQQRRVETLTQEIQRQEKAVVTAEQRAAISGSRPGNPADVMADTLPPANGASFLQNLQIVLGAPADSPQAAPKGSPKRIVVAIDNLDLLAPAQALGLMETSARLLGGPMFGLVLALDPRAIAQAGSNAAERLDRVVQVPAHLGRNGIAPSQSAAMVLSQLGHAASSTKAALIGDTGHSMLDRPMTVTEAKLLTELAALAGHSPRAVKRLVNLYRLVRGPVPEAALAAALFLALDLGGSDGELATMQHVLAQPDHSAPVELNEGSARLQTALQAVRTAMGGPVTGAALSAGLSAASIYMRR